jgi:ribosome-associated protein
LAKGVRKSVKKQEDDLIKVLIEGIEEKKGHQIVVIDLRGIDGTVWDHFIICHGDSSTQVEAIADSVARIAAKKLNQRVLRNEGMQNLQWVLSDFGDVVVHIFQKKYREFYKLEELWSDGKQEFIEEKN